VQRLIEGYKNFLERVLPDNSELYHSLAGGQAPEFLFITCCDSRIDPLHFTDTEPGDMFVERCLGNIIPVANGGDPQLNSIIEYSIVGLGVKHIIVCGHSGCGAMAGLLDPSAVQEMPEVAAWLRHAQETLDTVRSKYPDLEGDELLDATVHENVVVMLSRLERMPQVAERLKTGALTVHGWVFEIKKGRVKMYDPNSQAFIDLADASGPVQS